MGSAHPAQEFLVWVFTSPDRLPDLALDLLEDPDVPVWFSTVAQATAAGITLLTHDRTVAASPGGPVRLV